MTTLSAKEICLALGGRWHGGYGTALCPAHQNIRTPALSLADGRDGHLLVKCHAGCDFRNVIDALRRRGLVPPRDPRLGGSVRRERHFPSHSLEASAGSDELKHRKAAERLWSSCLPIEDTLAADYLERRSIQPLGSPALRFSPRCRHGLMHCTYPALIARVDRFGEGRLVGVHRTYLSLRATKIEREPARLALGPIRGGAVRLVVGQGALVVAEGLETALSAAALVAPPGASVWAGLTASGMAGLALPAEAGTLITAPDNDPAGIAAATALEDRARAAGWNVSRRAPPEGFGDWNDLAQASVGTRRALPEEH